MNKVLGNDEVVQCRDVRKVYKSSSVAVDHATFSIKRGECFGLLGPNGAGKSTLINMIYGATSRTAGDMLVLGKDPQTDSRLVKYRIGVVTQENALDESMTVLENMRIFAAFVNVPKHQINTRIEYLLDFMNLSHKRHARILELSGGMQRRLVFVRALLSEPELLILDEPTTGLDPAVRQLLWDKVSELKKQQTTVLLTTHYMDEAERLCDRLVIMDRGKVCTEGTPSALIAEHCPGVVAFFTDQSDFKRVRSCLMKEEVIDMAVQQERLGWRLTARNWSSLNELIAKMSLRPAIVRPTNLEDVFLQLTGRELGEDA